MTPDEIAALREDPAAVDELFRKLITETMSRWVDLAEDRLGGTGIAGASSRPGNDDPFFVDDLLSRQRRRGQPGRAGWSSCPAASR